MEPTPAQLIQLLNKLKNKTTNTEDELQQIDTFISQVKPLSTVKKFDKKKLNVILTEVFKWIVLGEKVLKEIIDLWTSHK